MNQSGRTKINQLLKSWPRGGVYTASWLAENGYPYDLVNLYRQSGWLQSIGRGAVVRADDKVPHWTGGVYALQQQLGLSVHPAGATALSLRGYAHNIPFQEKVFLMGAPGEKLPAWFAEYTWEAELIYTTSNIFTPDMKSGLEEYDTGDFSITISAPERAIMELLLLVPKYQTFEQAIHAMEGLLGLRAELTQQLLKKCRSIKVKRMFLYLAETLEMPWLNALNLKKVDLGTGKRVIAGGGHFNSKYGISVPYHEGSGT